MDSEDLEKEGVTGRPACCARYAHCKADSTDSKLRHVAACCCRRVALRCAAGEEGGLMVQEIDAYWLQRRISQTLDGLDAAAAQRLAQEVLEALQVSVLWQWSHQFAAAQYRTCVGDDMIPCCLSTRRQGYPACAWV